MGIHDAFIETWVTQAKHLGPRIHKRCWLVLAAQQKSNPYALGQAWGNGSEAHRWQTAYQEMGLVGLMDAPRAGRPQSITPQIQRLTSHIGTDPQEIGLLAKELPRNLREAIWRENRKTGNSMLRRHPKGDISVPVPATLGNLCGIHIEPHLIAVMVSRYSQETLSDLHGRWLEVPAARLQSHLDSWSVLGALNARFTEAKPQSSKQLQVRRTRWITACANLAHLHSNKMSMYLLCGLTDAIPTVHALSLFRQQRLFAHDSSKGTGLLRGLALLPFKSSYAQPLQMLVAALFEDALGNEASDLYEAMRKKRLEPFSWVRR